MSPALLTVKAKLLQTAHINEQQQHVQSLKQKKASTLLLLTILFFGVVYLIQINFLATRGYVMKDLEKQIASAKKENDAMNIRMLEAQGISKLQGKIEALGMVRSDSIEYLATQETVAVVR